MKNINVKFSMMNIGIKHYYFFDSTFRQVFNTICLVSARGS